MIVRPHPTGWQITLHSAHGLLAAGLFRQLANFPTGHLALPTLLAVAEHDDHQLDFTSGDYLTEAGAPKDFAVLKTTDQQRSLQAEALLEDSYRKHAWTYLLIGHHYEFLYAEQKVDKRLRQLLQTIADKRTKLLKANKWPATLLEKTYGQLRFCDRLSLLLCGEDLPALGRAVEVNDGLGVTAYLKQDPGSKNIGVEPWPFAEDLFTVSAEYFVLPQLSFPSSKALGEVLSNTVAGRQEWKFTAPAPAAPPD